MEGTVTIILVEPEKPGNIGSVARAVKNFGFRDLVIIEPRTVIGTESINYAVHAIDVLKDAPRLKYPAHCNDECKSAFFKKLFANYDIVVGTSCRIFRERMLHRIPISTRDFVKDLEARIDPRKTRIAVVFGRESAGLPNVVLKQVDFLVTIPTSGDYASLNLSHAVSIISYELSRVYHTGSPRGDIELSSKENRELLQAYFSEIVKVTNTPSHRIHRAEQAFKSIISRAHASSREITLLLGVFRLAVAMLKVEGENGNNGNNGNGDENERRC
ncbi:MAG: RNA methyltransferase [Promethearchaeota archaeon]